MPTELQPLVNELEALLRRAKEGPCPCLIKPQCDFCGGVTSPHSKRCDLCPGTGTITDPDLQAAWELLQGDYSVLRNGKAGAVSGIHIGPGVRDIVGLPDAMVRGLLEKVVEIAFTLEMLDKMGEDADYGWDKRLDARYFRWCGDVPALGKAIKEALNGMH